MTELRRKFWVAIKRTGGGCGHRHLDQATAEACQAVLTLTASNRAMLKATRKHTMGGRGKKYGLHGKKRSKRPVK